MSRVQIAFCPPPRKEKGNTMQTVVVNIYKEQFDVYIGRAGRGQDGYFGNPFCMGTGSAGRMPFRGSKGTLLTESNRILNSNGGYWR